MAQRHMKLLLVGGMCAAVATGTAVAGSARHAANTQHARPSIPPQVAQYDPLYGRSGKRVLVANLDGRSEVGNAGEKNVGNSLARGLASVGIRGTHICVGIVALDSGIPVAAHIHEGAKGKNGPVVIALKAPTPIEPGSVFSASSASCQNTDPALLGRIRKSPASFYVNVHTTDFPAGALRGQLRSANIKS
jgi:CHRD domain